MTENKPWGKFEVLLDAPYTKVKRITVKPSGILSYQYHKHRQDHWVVVKGVATVTLDTVIEDFHYNEHINIPLGIKHRLANNTEHPLVIIEIQTGTYFGEDDIIRLDDDYDRIY